MEKEFGKNLSTHIAGENYISPNIMREISQIDKERGCIHLAVIKTQCQ